MKHPRLEAADGLEELEEGSSENSSKDSMSTIADFEVGNETIGSQETVQTEITQPGESMAYLVIISNNLFQEHLLIAYSRPRNCDSACALPCSKFKQIRSIYPCLDLGYLPMIIIGLREEYQPHHRSSTNLQNLNFFPRLYSVQQHTLLV